MKYPLGFLSRLEFLCFCFDHKSFEELLSLIMNRIFMAVFILYFTNEAAVYPQKSDDFSVDEKKKMNKASCLPMLGIIYDCIISASKDRVIQ